MRPSRQLLAIGASLCLVAGGITTVAPETAVAKPVKAKCVRTADTHPGGRMCAIPLYGKLKDTEADGLHPVGRYFFKKNGKKRKSVWAHVHGGKGSHSTSFLYSKTYRIQVCLRNTDARGTLIKSMCNSRRVRPAR